MDCEYKVEPGSHKLFWNTDKKDINFHPKYVIPTP